MQVLVFTLGAAAVCSFFARHHWIADLVANLRIQLMIGLIASLALCLVHRRPKAVAIVIVIMASQIPWLVYPSQNRDSSSSVGDSALTVSFVNVLTRNGRHDDVISDLTSRDPDLVVVFELSSALADKLTRELTTEFPFALIRPQDAGNFGIGLFSKYPLEDQDVFVLNVPIKSIAVTTTVADQGYRVFATHPLPPMGAHAFASRNLHLKQLADRIQKFQRQSPQTPVLLVGDLNLTPWSPLFRDFEQSSGLARVCEGLDVTPTWYQRPGFPFGLVLDHGLISEALHCVSRCVGPDIGSDHRSVTLVLQPKK